MDSKQLVFGIFIILAGLVIALYYAASRGSVAAGVALGVLGTVFIFTIAWTLFMIQADRAEKARREGFRDNVMENASLLQAQFKSQAAGIQAQAKLQNQLIADNRQLKALVESAGADSSDLILFDDEIFENLEN